MEIQTTAQSQAKGPSHRLGRKFWIWMAVIFVICGSTYVLSKLLLLRGWTSYQLPQKYTDSIVTASAFDANDRLWIGISPLLYNSDFLLVFSPDSQWTEYELGAQINDIAFDSDSKPWIGSDQAVLTIGEDGEFTGFGSQKANTVAIDGQGRVWIGSNNYALRDIGVNVLNPDGLWITYTTSNSGLVDGQINTIEVDPLSRIWIGTHGGINVVNPDGTWMTYTPSNSILVDDDVRQFVFGDQGQVWIITHSNKIQLVDKNGEWTSPYKESTPDLGNVVLGIDRQNHLWVAGSKGLGKLGSNGKWVQYNAYNSGWKEHSINSLGFDTQERIYVITDLYGIIMLDERQAISPQFGTVLFHINRIMVFTMIASLFVVVLVGVISLPRATNKKKLVAAPAEENNNALVIIERRNIASEVSLIAGLLIFIVKLITSFVLPKLFPWEVVYPIQNYGDYLSFALALIAIIAGIISLIQIKKSGENGKWLAITGIILGVIPFMCLLAIIIYMASPWYF
jgi:hypothetical protein